MAVTFLSPPAHIRPSAVFNPGVFFLFISRNANPPPLCIISQYRAKRTAVPAVLLLYYICNYLTFRDFLSSLVFAKRSSSGTRIRQISAAVKPPLYRQKPPWRVGTEVTSR